MTRSKAARTKQTKAKADPAAEGQGSVNAPVIAEASELVSRAALLLRSLGPEYERIAWVLEDTIMYLGPGEVFFDFQRDLDEDPELQLEPLPRVKEKGPEGSARKVS